MEDCHRANVLVTSCLKTPVDPQTKAPLASYERDRVVPFTASGHVDNRDYEKEMESDDSASDFCDDHRRLRGDALVPNDCRAAGERLDLNGIFFSNEEYYRKLEELKKAHLRTMAELQSMYRRKLHLHSPQPLGVTALEAGHRSLWSSSSPVSSRRLRKSFSAVELRRTSASSDSSSNEDQASVAARNDDDDDDMEKGVLFSPKEHIKNMWRNYRLSPNTCAPSSSSLQSLPDGDQRRTGEKKRQGLRDGEQENWKHRVTVPKPFHMTLREAERRKCGIKTRSEMELENAVLRRQLEELTECQRKFHASPVPAHVHHPPYEERRRNMHEERRLGTVMRPFSFLERERQKKKQKQQRLTEASDQDSVKPFKAKPVPRSVYAAASGELLKEEELYRSIKIQMRAQELLHSAALPRSMLARRLNERKRTKDEEGRSFSYRPQINRDIPDFNASYRRFQRHLEKHKEVKPTTTCEPFDLRTSQIPSHRDRILADIEKQQSSPRTLRWPHVSPETMRTPTSSLGSSRSGSLELLPAKVTDATKRRYEAVRKVLERRKKAEEEEEQWKERQKKKEKKLQRVVLKRAEAIDPHLALSQTHQTKLKEFRKQDLQRKREYQQEIKEMQQRVKQRPLLLEQVMQSNAKQAAEKRYTDALHGCDVTVEFISSKANESKHARSSSHSSDSKYSDHDDADTGYQCVRYTKVFLNVEDSNDSDERERGRVGDESGEAPSRQRYHGGEEPDNHCSSEDDHGDDGYRYSDDHESYSGESERNPDTEQQEVAE